MLSLKIFLEIHFASLPTIFIEVRYIYIKAPEMQFLKLPVMDIRLSRACNFHRFRFAYTLIRKIEDKAKFFKTR